MTLTSKQRGNAYFDKMGLANQVAVPGFGHGTPNPAYGWLRVGCENFHNNKNMLNMTT